MSGRPTWVVIPALDEALTIERCIGALRIAAVRAPGPVHVVIVDDGSTDHTAELAAAALEAWGRSHAVLLGTGAGVGWARRTGLDHALEQAHALGAEDDALIATTDADSHVDADWFAELHAMVDDGAVVIAGDVLLDPATDERLVAARHRRLRDRLAALHRDEPGAPHPHFAGSNLAFTVATIRRLQPLPAPTSLEDAAILRKCKDLGLPVVRHGAARVFTSSRLEGRAPNGLAAALAVDIRTFDDPTALADAAA